MERRIMIISLQKKCSHIEMDFFKFSLFLSSFFIELNFHYIEGFFKLLLKNGSFWTLDPFSPAFFCCKVYLHRWYILDLFKNITFNLLQTDLCITGDGRHTYYFIQKKMICLKRLLTKLRIKQWVKLVPKHIQIILMYKCAFIIMISLD